MGMCAKAPRVELPPTACGWVGGEKRWKLHTLRAVNWLHLRAEPSSPATLLSQHDHDDVSMLLMTTTHQMTMTYDWLHCMLLYHMPFRRYPTRPACMLTLFFCYCELRELNATHKLGTNFSHT